MNKNVYAMRREDSPCFLLFSSQEKAEEFLKNLERNRHLRQTAFGCNCEMSDLYIEKRVVL